MIERERERNRVLVSENVWGIQLYLNCFSCPKLITIFYLFFNHYLKIETLQVKITLLFG